MWDIVVVGGGAAGLMAAVSAARESAGLKICVAERMDRVGKKLLATGNGRCNLTNTRLDPGCYHSHSPEFVQLVLERFGSGETIAFFRSLGLLCREEQGRVYPYSLQANAVLDSLRLALSAFGVTERCGFEASGLQRAGCAFRLTSAEGEELLAKRMILAAGGKAGPSLGSNGSGYRLFSGFGHRLYPVFPALSALKCEHPELRSLKGVRAMARVGAYRGGKLLREESGELQFAENALSGIPVMQLSRLAGESDEPLELRVDFLPEYPAREIPELLARRISLAPDSAPEELLSGLFHKRVGRMLLKEAGIDPPSRPVKAFSRQEEERLVGVIKSCVFRVAGAVGWPGAQVTAGGADCGEFCAGTMESRLAPGLYLAGEILDVDGDCGGFNLQWAWATGYLAGRAAAGSLPGS